MSDKITRRSRPFWRDNPRRSLLFVTALAFFILALISYRILRIRFIAGRLNEKQDLSPQQVAAENRHIGLKAYNIYKDGKDFLVFYRPMGFSRPAEMNSRGEDMVYIATEISLPESPTDTARFRLIFDKLLESIPQPNNGQSWNFYPLIPPGAAIKNINFSRKDGILTLDFNRKFSSGGGSLAMSQSRLAVEETARQFPEVKSVRILVEGKEFNFEP